MDERDREVEVDVPQTPENEESEETVEQPPATLEPAGSPDQELATYDGGAEKKHGLRGLFQRLSPTGRKERVEADKRAQNEMIKLVHSLQHHLDRQADVMDALPSAIESLATMVEDSKKQNKRLDNIELHVGRVGTTMERFNDTLFNMDQTARRIAEERKHGEEERIQMLIRRSERRFATLLLVLLAAVGAFGWLAWGNRDAIRDWLRSPPAQVADTPEPVAPDVLPLPDEKAPAEDPTTPPVVVDTEPVIAPEEAPAAPDEPGEDPPGSGEAVTVISDTPSAPEPAPEPEEPAPEPEEAAQQEAEAVKDPPGSGETVTVVSDTPSAPEPAPEPEEPAPEPEEAAQEAEAIPEPPETAQDAEPAPVVAPILVVIGEDSLPGSEGSGEAADEAGADDEVPAETAVDEAPADS